MRLSETKVVGPRTGALCWGDVNDLLGGSSQFDRLERGGAFEQIYQILEWKVESGRLKLIEYGIVVLSLVVNAAHFTAIYALKSPSPLSSPTTYRFNLLATELNYHIRFFT